VRKRRRRRQRLYEVAVSLARRYPSKTLKQLCEEHDLNYRSVLTELCIARYQGETQLRKHDYRWFTPEEKEILNTLLKQGYQITTIARELQRTPAAIYSYIKRYMKDREARSVRVAAIVRELHERSHFTPNEIALRLRCTIGTVYRYLKELNLTPSHNRNVPRRRWSEEEERLLQDAYARGEPSWKIALQLSRSLCAIEQRLKALRRKGNRITRKRGK